MQGYILQMQPFSVNDGEGIRTTIFMAGCPMHCKWCANPEALNHNPKIGWYERKCTGCGECVKVCPQGVGINLNLERDKCIGCGKCVDVCTVAARTNMISLIDSEDVIKKIEEHRIFYAYSGGGITFSGGEATTQSEFLDELSSRIYDLGYNMALETCGLFDFETVQSSLERMDLIFMDLKHMDSEQHKKYTGVSNELILSNMSRLSELRAEVVIRIPCIGGVNADEDNIRKSAEYVHNTLPKAKIELLPYHKFGLIKYEALGISEEAHDEFYRPESEQMEKLKTIVIEAGVELADYR